MTEPTVDVVCDDHAVKGHCALHRLLWEHNDNDRREHRTDICNKILAISNSITAIVPRWVFVLVVGGKFRVFADFIRMAGDLCFKGARQYRQHPETHPSAHIRNRHGARARQGCSR